MTHGCICVTSDISYFFTWIAYACENISNNSHIEKYRSCLLTYLWLIYEKNRRYFWTILVKNRHVWQPCIHRWLEKKKTTICCMWNINNMIGCLKIVISNVAIWAFFRLDLNLFVYRNLQYIFLIYFNLLKNKLKKNRFL